jgi:hypothetical protein
MMRECGESNKISTARESAEKYCRAIDFSKSIRLDAQVQNPFPAKGVMERTDGFSLALNA